MPQLPAIGEEVPPVAAAASARPALPPIGGEVGARVPDFTATNEPPSTALKAAAYGKDALQLALEALPGAGAVVGGALATPETLGGGTLAGAALGAGAGRGLRDLVAAGLGLQKPSTAMAEGGKIAMDAGETYLAGKVLPALWEAIKAPGATVADVVDRTKILYKALPKAAKAFLPDFEQLAKLPKGVGQAPAAILERPAWQTWQEHLPDAQPSPQVARTTGTSMIPAAVPPAVPPPAPAPVALAVRAPAVGAPAAADVPAVQAPRANGLPNQKLLNELAIQARRAGIKLTPAMEQTAIDAVGQGATPQQAVRGFAPVAPAAPAPPPPAAEPILAASGKMQLTAPEMKEFQRLVARGMKLPDALEQVKAMRELATRLGGATSAEVAADVAHRQATGKW